MLIGGDPGIGKSTILLQVCRHMAESGKKVLAVDGDCGLRNLDLALGMADRVVFMDGGVIVEQGDPQEVISNPKEERTRQFLARFAAK